jgi:hypothetical protein
MRKEHRRTDALDADAIVNVVIDSELRAQIKAFVALIVKMIADAPSPPDPVPGSPGSPSLNYLDLVNAIAYATANLLSSPTVFSLSKNIDELVDLTALVNTELNGCGCIKDFGLQPLLYDLGRIIDAVLGMQRWCGNHPIGVPAHPHSSPPGQGLPPSPDPNGSNDTIVVGLDDLLNVLGLHSKNTAVVVGGLGSEVNKPVNKLLTGLMLGPANVRYRRGDPLNVDAAVVDQITAIVKLSLVLKDDSSTLPVPPPDSPSISGTGFTTPPIDKNLVNAILDAVGDLVGSTHVSALLDNIDALVDVNAAVTSALGGCDCAGRLRLEKLMEDVEDLLNATLGLQSWCSDHPIVPHPGPAPSGPSNPPNPSNPSPPSAPGQGPSPANPGNDLGLPIDLQLGDLLASLGLNLDANVALQGLVQSLVDLVIKLQGNSNVLPVPSPAHPAHPPTRPPPNHHLDQNLVGVVVQLTRDLLQSLTSDDLSAKVNALLDVSVILRDALNGCGCVRGLVLENLVKNVDDILSRLLGIKRWCENHPPGGPAPPGSTKPIIIDAERLLSSLGLDGLLKVNGVLDLGNGLNKPVNGLLKSLGLGGVKRWLGL